MDVKKKRSKGGFLHLFDWHGRSGKKLFENSTNLQPEGSNQGKESVGNVLKSQPHMHTEVGLEDTREASSKAVSTATSVICNDGYGTGGPGVVARLMGLDSLPRSNVPKPHLCSSQASQDESVFSDAWIAYHQPSRQSMLCKAHNSPIEKFQTEMLPPKFTNSTPITNNRIRDMRFTETRNGAYVMETAARIIDPCPQGTLRTKVSSDGSSSTALKMRKYKKKVEAAHKGSKLHYNDISSANFMNRQLCDETNCVSEGIEIQKTSGKGIPGSLNTKDKSLLLAVQAKANVKRREGSKSTGTNRSLRNQKEKTNSSCLVPKSQSDMQRTSLRGTSTYSNKTVLKQNNQKQNFYNLRPSSDQQGKKPNALDGVAGTCNIIDKAIVGMDIRSKKTVPTITRAEEDFLLCRRKISSRNKQPLDKKLERVSDGVLIRRIERSLKCNTAAENEKMKWGTINSKKDIEVVSFTFSSPMKRHGLPHSSSLEMEKVIGVGSNTNCLPSSKSSMCITGLNVIGAHALSDLLEQKLRELTCKVESAECNFIQKATSSSDNLLRNFPATVELGFFNSTSLVSTEACNLADPKQPDCWELDYIRKLLHGAELTLTEFVMGQTDEFLISSTLFHHLENNFSVMKGNEYAEQSSLRRKVLFDSVNECMELRFGHIFSCITWDRRAKLLNRKEQLAEDLCKEIRGWNKMGDLMVDELVDKDMSSSCGRWTNYDVEICREGLEIEEVILTFLVDELVSDLVV